MEKWINNNKIITQNKKKMALLKQNDKAHPLTDKNYGEVISTRAADSRLTTTSRTHRAQYCSNDVFRCLFSIYKCQQKLLFRKRNNGIT